MEKLCYADKQFALESVIEKLEQEGYSFWVEVLRGVKEDLHRLEDLEE